MKILIVGQYYYPDNFRINEVSQALAESGNVVDMLTGLPDYSTGKIPKEYKWFKKRRECINGVNVVRVPVIARRRGLFWRILNYISFMVHSTIYTMLCKKNYDVIMVYQTSPITMANAAIKMKERTHCPLFLYCLDIWPECLKAWNVQEDSLVYRVIHRYSKYVYKHCDMIGVSSRPFIRYLSDVNDVLQNRMRYIPQHCEDAFYDICGQYVDNNITDFTFAGNIGSVQDVECIIKAASRLTDLNNFKIHVVGNGTDLEHCKDLAAQLKVQDKVVFYGYVNKDQLGKYYQITDVFLLTLKSDTFIGMTMPAKLQEYMSLGKPILAAIGGAARGVINEAGCGIVVDSADDVGLAEGMRRFISGSEDINSMGFNARSFFDTNFTKKIFMDNINDIIKRQLEVKEYLNV